MKNLKWGKGVLPADRRDQLKLVYDYVKFHISLYLGTPAAVAVIADGFGVKQSWIFAVGLLLAIFIYIAAGADAGYFMSRHVNDPWQANFLEEFEKDAFSKRRRFRHHTLYWAGLIAGLLGLFAALIEKWWILAHFSNMSGRPYPTYH